MESVIVGSPGCFLGKTGERLIVRGPRPRLELIEGGPQLQLPFDLPAPPPLTLVTSNGPRTPETPLRRRFDPIRRRTISDEEGTETQRKEALLREW